MERKITFFILIDEPRAWYEHFNIGAGECFTVSSGWRPSQYGLHYLSSYSIPSFQHDLMRPDQSLHARKDCNSGNSGYGSGQKLQHIVYKLKL